VSGADRAGDPQPVDVPDLARGELGAVHQQTGNRRWPRCGTVTSAGASRGPQDAPSTAAE
jgi:hypothetical protein